MIKDTFEIKVTTVGSSKVSQVDWDNLPFGRVFTDHMLVMDYKDGQWQTPEITPFENLTLHPAVSAIHYGQSIFEGMKANRTENGEIVLFRPDMNGMRLQESCERMCMPTIPLDLFVECVRKMVEVEKNWIPEKQGYSLYIRPVIFATDEYIGIKPSETYKFIIFCCPVGAYYSEPVNVKIEEFYTRATEGGVGRAKTAGNYAASLYPAKIAQAEGYHQLIWTDSKTHKFIEESGTMNVMFLIGDKLITPSEENDTILRGITKRSVIELAISMGFTIEERKVSVEEVITAARNGELHDAFGIGTAATIAHIAKIGFRDEVFMLKPVEERTISNQIKDKLNKIKLGTEPDNFGWCLKV